MSPTVVYRYEVRRGAQLVATGRMSNDRPLEVGERVKLTGQLGVVRSIEPVPGGGELRLVVVLPAGERELGGSG